MSLQLSPEQKSAISRISGLILVNAMIFQEILSENDNRVHALRDALKGPVLINQLADHWQFIIEEIDYFPIFHIAYEILSDLTSNRDVRDGLLDLMQTAQQIVEMRAALRHDLMGRVYHRLLSDA